MVVHIRLVQGGENAGYSWVGDLMVGPESGVPRADEARLAEQAQMIGQVGLGGLELVFEDTGGEFAFGC